MLSFTILFFIISSFIIFFVIFSLKRESFESFTSTNGNLNCATLLIQKGNNYYLYNTNQPKIDGVNPLIFTSLDQYTNFLKWQRSQGIRCPVAILQQTIDSQGNNVYQTRTSLTEPQAGSVPANTTPLNTTPNINVNNNNNLPPLPMKFEGVDAGSYNSPNYPDFNQSMYYRGSITPAGIPPEPKDVVANSNYNALYSDNAMDPNWGGQEYTQALLDAGYYKGNEVYIRTP